MKRVIEDSEWFRRISCRLGFHKWSVNYNGMRVCLRRGCTRIDLYYGITGMLRYMRERQGRSK